MAKVKINDKMGRGTKEEIEDQVKAYKAAFKAHSKTVGVAAPKRNLFLERVKDGFDYEQING